MGCFALLLHVTGLHDFTLRFSVDANIIAYEGEINNKYSWDIV
jgi:hypothetical protein